MDNLTVETCFHYLTLCAEDIPDDAVQFKCCPPIRDEANRQALIKAVEEGVIDYVVSDHSPCIPELKKGGFVDGWGGISGLGYGLPLMWTHLGQLGLPKIVQLLSGRQAKQVGLEGRKGEIVQGADADFVVFDPEERYTLQQVRSFYIRQGRVRGPPCAIRFRAEQADFYGAQGEVRGMSGWQR